MSNPRKISVVTGARAEYGLLKGLMEEIRDDPECRLQLIVTGTHLEPRFGLTVKEIEDDGFTIDRKIPCDLSDDRPQTLTAAMATIAMGMSNALEELKPDIVVILGDRFEILAVAQACLMHRVPIAHIHGGEATEGVIDDAIRHAVSKMAHLHFASAEPYRQRLIQMGENPERVFSTGAPGLDQIVGQEFLSREDLLKDLSLEPHDADYFLLTYHPVTLDEEESLAGANALLQALEGFPEFKVIITGVNADTGGSAIDNLLNDYASVHSGRVIARSNLGQHRYLSAMAHAAAVIGNSSSGLIEAPSLGVATVNIGERQKGRLSAPSVISCCNSKEEINAAIQKAIGPSFQEIARAKETPYGGAGASRRIKDILRNSDLRSILFKSFNTLSEP